MKKFLLTIDTKLGRAYVPVVLLLMLVALFGIGYSFVKPYETVIQLNSVATQTIRANKTIEDEAATQKNKELVALNTQKVYEKDENIALLKIAEVNQFFEVVKKYRDELAKEKETDARQLQEERTSVSTSSATKVSEAVTRFFDSLNTDNAHLKAYSVALSESILTQLFSAKEKEYTNYETITKRIVQQMLQQEDIDDVTIDAVRKKALVEIRSATYSENERDLINDLVSPAIVVNKVENAEATETKKQDAMANVAPVMISQGEVIVREGEVIGRTVYDKLALLGMTKDSFDIQKLLGYLVLLFVQFCVVLYFILHQDVTLTKKNAYANLYVFVNLLLMVLVAGASLIQGAGLEYFSLSVPLGIAPFLMVPKAKRRLSIILLAFVVASYFFLSDSSLAIQTSFVWQFYTLMSMFSTVVVRGSETKTLFRSFTMLIVLYVAVVISLALFYGIDLRSRTFSLILVYTAVNAFLTIVLLKLGQSYFDLLFEDKAVLKMLELSNPNQPLLKELIEKAPGTYHHSIMVANLSANAVELIGGDSLFTRVACYYHDVGKVKNPMFFVENLPGGMENPHNLLTPQESRDIIFDHVTDGVAILTKAGLPKDIVDICAQHHGTTVMKYFYTVAKEADDSVSEDDFRYPGPRPTTKESAVVSITDTVEAATRAMKNPTHEAIEKLVHSVIQSRIQDGQFDDCPITMQELKIVEESLVKGLSGSYHTRIEYPKMKRKKN